MKHTDVSTLVYSMFEGSSGVSIFLSLSPMLAQKFSS